MHSHKTHNHFEHSNEYIHENHNVSTKDYLQFAAIVLSILIISVVVTFLIEFNFTNWMRFFMGLFFLTFGLFKIINYKEFIVAYRRYDIFAKRSKLYASAYPFIEIILGILYTLDLFKVPLNIFTAILMFVSLIGVVQTLQSNKTIMCACLGAVVKLPVTKITLLENLTMGLMALLMLVM